MKIIPSGAIPTIFICVLFGVVNGQSSDAERSNNAACDPLQFRCLNGQCIRSELLCDGRADCSDGSDETKEECTKSEIICPEYAFRCNYGACIDGDGTCNGIDDCVDRSDELLPRCVSLSNSNGTSTGSGSCNANEFRCNNGQCIPGTSICDGKVDCSDRSDEILALCEKINCLPFTFRCNYGACIDQKLKCNGVFDCADGSDEAPSLCRGIYYPTPKPPIIDRTTEPSRPTRPPCQIPSQPQNGRWQLHKSQCAGNDHCDVGRNVKLEPGTYLIYSCNYGYKIKGSADVFCGPEGKWSSKPVCVEIRCRGLNTASTEADCTYNDEWASCDGPVLPRTVARVSCRYSYRQDVTFLSSQRENVRCSERGQWVPEPIRCVPVCGVISPKSTPLIVNGSRPNITDFPWHATLYRSDEPGGEKEFICGATIIQSDLLITAAHCVYDEGSQTVDDPAKFAVATGNTFRDYNSIFHDPKVVKKANVKRIYVICNYLGFPGNYARDIAILHLDAPFVFSSILVPVCLDTSSFSDQSVLQVGNYGKIAGFGRTSMKLEEASSQVLQSLNVPYVQLDECKATSVGLESEKFITIDKFCAGYRNGSSVCDGDSGGGLVFKSGGLWYLRGIVSVGIGATVSGGRRICDSHAYSLYTRVSSHIEWIQNVILKLETYNTYPECPKKIS